MAEVAAPYITGTDLLQLPGDANASGVAGNFDPANKAPLAALQQTMDRQDAENFAALKQRQQQQRQFDHDILVRHMENEQQEKILKHQEELQQRQQLFNLFNQTGATSASLKGPDGADMSIPFLPDDDKKLNSETNDFQKWSFDNPSQNLYSSDFTQKMNDLKHKRINASMRSVYYKKAEQAMANTYDPKERERLQKYMDDIKSEPLTASSMPHPYVEQPAISPMIDVEKEYKDGKGYEEFGDNGSGVPNSRYLGLAATTDPQKINEGFKRYQFFRSQPEGQSAEAYQAWKQKLDAITDARDLPRINFPVMTTDDGKVAFDDNTYAKQQVVARNFLAASELMNNGYLKQPDSADVLKQKELEAKVAYSQAQARKENIEADLKSVELRNGKPLTAEQQETKKYVLSQYSRAQEAFTPTGPAVTANFPTWWAKSGISTDKYNIYDADKDATARYIGMEAPAKKETDKAKGTVTETKGLSVVPDKVYLIQDKNTGEKKLVYLDVKKQKVLAKVSEKDAVINGLKHEAKYDPKVYEKQVGYIEDAYSKADAKANTASSSKSSDDSDDAIQARLVPVTMRKPDGTVIKAMKDPKTGKYYAA